MAGLRGPIGDPDSPGYRHRPVPLTGDAATVAELERLFAKWLQVSKEAVAGLAEEGCTYQTATGYSRPTAHVANFKEATSQLRQLALAIARLRAATDSPSARAEAQVAAFDAEFEAEYGLPPRWKPEALPGGA